MKLKRILIIPFLLLAAGLSLAACGSDSNSADVKVADVWARSTAPGQTTSAIYMKIEGGSKADRLLSATVPADIAGKVEIHETTAAAHGKDGQADAGHMADGSGKHGDMMNGGTPGNMAMRPVDAVDVPAGKDVMLEPGGFHVMLFDLAAPLKAGQKIPVTLTFEQAGEVKVDAEVRDY